VRKTRAAKKYLADALRNPEHSAKKLYCKFLKSEKLRIKHPTYALHNQKTFPIKLQNKDYWSRNA